METQLQPQIYVVSQKMLQQQHPNKSLLKLSSTNPTLAPAIPKYRVIVSEAMKTNTMDKVQIAKSRPIATVVGCKRPAEQPLMSPLLSPKSEITDEDDDDMGAPIRKRANLDHLSPEERLQRRKLKNRVAAQNARDKKKAQCEEMEKMIEQMKFEKQQLVAENARLQAANTQLQLENASLSEENCEYKQKLGLAATIELPMSPSSLPPASPSPAMSPLSAGTHCSPVETTMAPPESAALTNDPQPQEQGAMSPVASQWPGLSSHKDLTPWALTSYVVTLSQCLLVTLMIISQQQPSSPPSPKSSPSQSQPPPLLPLKKRDFWKHRPPPQPR